jgi:hypothetical protein
MCIAKLAAKREGTLHSPEFVHRRISGGGAN